MAIRSITRSPARPIRSPILSAVSAGVIASVGAPYNNIVASHAFDYTTNNASINGVVSTIASIPSISGTLDLSSSGHLVSGAANGLIIPLTGVTYPLTFLVEFIRNTDTGGTEQIARLDDGDTTDLTMLQINASDSVRFVVSAASVQQANIVCGGLAVATLYRVAGRVATDSVQAARITSGTLGTEDTAVTLPANPTRLVVGVDSAGAHTFTGYIRKIKIYPGAATDAQLQALATDVI